jgi:hypothetical protein
MGGGKIESIYTILFFFSSSSLKNWQNDDTDETSTAIDIINKPDNSSSSWTPIRDIVLYTASLHIREKCHLNHGTSWMIRTAYIKKIKK